MKRRIAFISEHASPLAALGGTDSGGQNVYVSELAKELVLLGYSVDIYTRYDDMRFPKIVEWTEGVRVIHIKAGPVEYVRKEELLPYMDEFTQNMIKFIEKNKLDYKLIHANFWMSGLVADKIKKIKKIPFIITFHALGAIRLIHQKENDHFPKERIQVEKQIIKETDRVIAECPQDREDLINYYEADPSKINIVPCGFNPHEFHPIDKLLSRTVLNLDPDEKIILQLGRMVPRKGIDKVIQALSILIHRYKTSARLLIVGGETTDPDPQKTPEIQRLQKIAKDLSVEKYVTFTGKKNRETLKYYYNSADVFVSTPWYEPFGITPLESMACGTPVIGSDVGGIKYSVIHGKTGFLVPPHNAEVLALRLLDILSNQKITNYFKENAIRRVNSTFTWTKVANSIANIYETINFPEKNKIKVNLGRLEIINNSFESVVDTFNRSKELLRIPILDAASKISQTLKKSGKILACGNGGSAADASHFAGEFVGRFIKEKRKALPVISLTNDMASITGWANDLSYQDIFSRQVEALGESGDVLIGISTSGKSQNIIKAFEKAHEKNMLCIGLIGKDGGPMLNEADIVVLVPSYNTQRIQEVQINILHTIAELVEKQLFSHQEEEKEINLLENIFRLKIQRTN